MELKGKFMGKKKWPFLGAPSPLKCTRLFRGRSVAEAEAKKFLGILESSKSRKSEKKWKNFFGARLKPDKSHYYNLERF